MARLLAATVEAAGVVTVPTGATSTEVRACSCASVAAICASIAGETSHRFHVSSVQLLVNQPIPTAPPATASHASALAIAGVTAIDVHSPVITPVSIH